MTKQRYQLVIVIDAPKGRTSAEVGHAALQALEDTEGLTVVSLVAKFDEKADADGFCYNKPRSH